MKNFFLFIIICTSLFSISNAQTFDLNNCIDYANENNNEIKEISFKEIDYLSKVKEAEGAFYPKFSFLTYIAPTYSMSGDENSYQNDYSVWGPYWHTLIEANMPIYTWGKIDYFKNAALNGVLVSKEEILSKRRDIEYEIRKYYYGFQLAKTLEKVVDDIIKVLDEAIKKGTQIYEEGNGDIKKSDLEMLKVYMGEALKNKHLTEKSTIMARLALMQKMGMKEKLDFNVKEEKIKRINYNLKDPDYYVDLAFKNRAEWKMLKYGLKAKSYLVDAEKTEKYPVFFLAAQFVYDKTPNIEDQKNPWIYDRYNNTTGGIAVGAKFDFSFKSINAKIESKIADLSALKAKEDFAKDAIILQIKNTYYNAIEAQKNIDSAKDALKSADKWVIAAGLVYGIGTGDVKDALEGLGAKAKTQKDYYQAIYDYNLAISELSKNCGLRDLNE